MAHHEDQFRRTRRRLAPQAALVSIVAVVGSMLFLGPAAWAGCDDGEDDSGEVQCDDREEREGDDGDSGDGGRSDDADKGDTWTEYHYVLCVEVGEDHPNDDTDGETCEGTLADSCDDGEDYYWVDTRVWTYDGSEWTHEQDDDDGWDIASDNGCHDLGDEVTEDMVIRAFNSHKLPSGEIGVNPPNGRTLVNLDTIVHTDQGEERTTLPLEEVDTSVDIIATPTNYHWDFGDGESADWSTKGHAWEKGRDKSDYHTHAYTDTGSFTVELTIDYDVQYNDGNGWETISEPITSEASDVDLEVVEQRNRLHESR